MAVFHALRIMALNAIGVLVLPLAIMAQEQLPVCEKDLTFYRRLTNVVSYERDRYIQIVAQKDMQIAYLKQQIEQMKKAKAQSPEEKE